MQAKDKTKHGGARVGSGRKPKNVLTCPTCVVLAEQLKLAGEREKALLKQLSVKDDQIGTVIESKFETVRITNQPLPEADKPAMPIEQLMDVDVTDDSTFIKKVSEMAH